MNQLPKRIGATLLSGAIASMGIGIIIWGLHMAGVFKALSIPIDLSNIDPQGWFLNRVVYGALCGLLFLIPVLKHLPQWKRGLAWGGVAPLPFFLVVYPDQGQGYFGLNSGVLLPLAAWFFWLLWGAGAGLWLEKTHRMPANHG